VNCLARLTILAGACDAGAVVLTLTGRESLTLEVELGCGLAAAPHPELELEAPGQVSLLLFAMEQMHAEALPWPKLRYREALWRVRVRHRGAPAFFASACDLDHPLVKALGRTAIRYPVRDASFAFEDGAAPRFSVRSPAGALELVARPSPDVAPVIEPLPVLTLGGKALYRIPWRETPTPERVWASLEVRDGALAEATLGAPVTWPSRAVLMRGRQHHCGLATPASR
jgi:hypothetical protein